MRTLRYNAKNGVVHDSKINFNDSKMHEMIGSTLANVEPTLNLSEIEPKKNIKNVEPMLNQNFGNVEPKFSRKT